MLHIDTHWRKCLHNTNWRKCFIFTHKLSMSSFFQQKSYNILSLWYRTPVDLHRMYPSSPVTCWRCMEGEGTFGGGVTWFLYFGTRSSPLTFWCIFLVYRPPLKLPFCLWFVGSSPKSKKGSWDSLLAAFAAISCHWKFTSPPHILEWSQILIDIMAMETLVAEDSIDLEKVHSTWTCWRAYAFAP